MGGQTYWKIRPESRFRINIHSPGNMTLRIREGSPYRSRDFAIYVLHYLLGREVEEVTAFADPNGVDKSIACLKFNGDVYGFAMGSQMIPSGTRSIIVYGTDGRMTE